MDDYVLWLILSKVPSKEKLRLLKKFKTAESVWYHIMEQKNYDMAQDSKVAGQLRDSWDIKKIEWLKNKKEKDKIDFITIDDKDYPNILRNFEDCPYALFFKGDISKLNEGISVSIVGSRNCSRYGEDVTKLISSELTLYNINIVSGMAKGIDTFAHEACIKKNGYTCAVLGCGIDVVYPKQNREVYNRILETGCLISEFLPETEPFSYNFPRRNRIISALSNIVIVVEAGIKSGSLITAGLALEMGKDVMAVPGSVFSEQSKGTNRLIKDGAYPVTCLDDIFNLLGLNYSKLITTKNSYIPKENKKIYDIITDNPIHLDDILRFTNIDIKQLYEVLFEMQLRNEIICLSGNYYVRVNNEI